jgi:hypothetical protein
VYLQLLAQLHFTQRNIQVCPRTSFDALCLKDLDTKYLGISSLWKEVLTTKLGLLLTLILSYWLTNSRKQMICSFGSKNQVATSSYGGTCAVGGLNYYHHWFNCRCSCSSSAATGSFTSTTALDCNGCR